MKTMTNDSMLALAAFACARDAAVSQGNVDSWAAPVRGIAVPVPASQLGGLAVAGTTAAANAAKGADRTRTTGYQAFEDPT